MEKDTYFGKSYYLSADLGGTNSRVALIEREGGTFTPLFIERHKSREIRDLPGVFRKAFILAEREDKTPAALAISAAGPVRDNRCTMTNLPWVIDGGSLTEQLKIPCRVMNDFSALGYALPTLDLEDPSKVLPLPQPGGVLPKPSGSVWGLVGAGTGLGTGFVVQKDKRVISLSSEGGHTDFPVFDEETWQLQQYLSKKIGFNPEVERVVSGSGIASIYDFYRGKGVIEDSENTRRVDSKSENEKPEEISRIAKEDPSFAPIFHLFVRCYARFAANLALIGLCSRGIFLAGGIAAKNEIFFLSDFLFVESFVFSKNPVLRNILFNTPVYLLKDYDLSLIGAVKALQYLEGKEETYAG